MALELPSDFSEFLRLLSSRNARYLVVGGWAVAWHGYPRSTQDLDVWISVDDTNAEAVVDAIREFGFDTPNLSRDLFRTRDRIVRMGHPPIRTKVMTSISGLQFDDAWERRIEATFGDLQFPLINLDDLKSNKRAAARHKDLDDLEHLP